MKKYLPILSWLPAYNRTWLKGDLSAGLTVGVMLIPQGMAYAMIAGLPPIFGLYASIIPLLVYAIFGTSRQLAVGPVAMISLLVAASVSQLTEGGTVQDYIEMTILLALMVGVLQLLMGIFKLGFLVNFLSTPVISGFTSAAAIIILFSQLKHLLGVSVPRSKYVHEIAINLWELIGTTHIPTLLLGLGGIALLLFAKKIHKNMPGPLLLVALGILGVWGLGLGDLGLKITGEVPSGLPSFTVPTLSWEGIKGLFPIALTISLVAFMQSIAVAKVLQNRHRNYKIDYNQELKALGLANIGGAFFQSFPVTGGFARSAVNDQMGAQTPMAAIISASLICLTLLFLTPVFYYLPNAVLASLIMVAVLKLIDIKEVVFLLKTDRKDFLLLLVTFLATLSIGIQEGILVGVVLSLAIVIFNSSLPHFAFLARIPGTRQYRNITRFTALEEKPHIQVFRFDARLYFANVNAFTGALEQMIENKRPDLKLIVIEAGGINHIDSTGLHSLEELMKTCQSQNILLYFSGVIGPVRDLLSKSGWMDKIGKAHFFMSIQDAVDYYESQPGLGEGPENAYATQTNLI